MWWRQPRQLAVVVNVEKDKQSYLYALGVPTQRPRQSIVTYHVHQARVYQKTIWYAIADASVTELT